MQAPVVHRPGARALIQQLASGLFIIALVSACDQHKTSTVTSVRSQPAGTGSSETTVAGIDFVPSTARITNLCQRASGHEPRH
jgi:hypothetical protein